MRFDVDLHLPGASSILDEAGLLPGGPVQKFIDSEILRLSNPKAPFRTGYLANVSPQIGTVIGSGILVYAAPYALRMYTHPEFNFYKGEHPEAGAYWVERMWTESGEQILRGAEKMVTL